MSAKFKKEVRVLELSDRKQKILASVVKSYVTYGEPVGSKLIADEIGVSSATVRNEMAELISMGLLLQPHTSAGRIPTQQGYREYIDNIMEEKKISPRMKMYFDSILAISAFDRDRLVIRASEALSAAMRMMGIATTPSGRNAKISAVQFVQIGRRTAMLILLSDAGTMKTKVFHCEFDLTMDMMRVFFRVFNENLSEKKVSDINPAFIQTMAISFGNLALLTSSALGALIDAANETMRTDVDLNGQMNLLLYPEFTHEGVKSILDVFERKDDVLSMINEKPNRPTVLLGSEMNRNELHSSAMVISPYMIKGTQAGVLSLVGPMRMDYPSVLACSEYVSERVGDMLTSMIEEE
jgi:heat-inducible transcriptional repressor